MSEPLWARRTRVRSVVPFILFAAVLALMLAPDGAVAQDAGATVTSAATQPGATAATAAEAAATPAKPQIDTGSTAWMMTSSALVLFMVPGLALFYGGMVRAKNVLNMFLCCMVAIGVIGLHWIIVGYALAFNVVTPETSLIGSGDPIVSFL